MFQTYEESKYCLRQLSSHSFGDKCKQRFHNRGMSLAKRIVTARKAAGLSQEELAKACGVSRAAVAQWEGGETSPKHTNLAPAATKLKVSVAWLLGEGGEGAPTPSHEVDLDRIQSLPGSATLARDLPVIGTAAGGDNGDFELNGQTVDYVRRPPALAGLKDAFAIYLVGHSMEPRYDNGGLLFVHPGRPVSPGCDVLVELHADNGDVGHCMVKTLVRQAGGKYILQQYNPPRDDIEVPAERVRHIYRVLRNEELLGV